MRGAIRVVRMKPSKVGRRRAQIGGGKNRLALSDARGRRGRRGSRSICHRMRDSRPTSRACAGRVPPSRTANSTRPTPKRERWPCTASVAPAIGRATRRNSVRKKFARRACPVLAKAPRVRFPWAARVCVSPRSAGRLRPCRQNVFRPSACRDLIDWRAGVAIYRFSLLQGCASRSTRCSARMC